jgi:integrase/recombinase XerD
MVALEVVIGGRTTSEPIFVNRLGQAITRFGIHTLVERYTLRICAKFPALATKRVSPHSIRHYVASRTISGKFGFGSFFGHISRFTGYIVLPPSTPPARGQEP